jgi:hypothetical protein
MNTKQTLLILIMSATLAVAGQVSQYKVHYSIHGAGHDIIVLAETSEEARNTVEDMFPNAVVYGASKK